MESQIVLELVQSLGLSLLQVLRLENVLLDVLNLFPGLFILLPDSLNVSVGDVDVTLSVIDFSL